MFDNNYTQLVLYYARVSQQGSASQRRLSCNITECNRLYIHWHLWICVPFHQLLGFRHVFFCVHGGFYDDETDRIE